MVHRWRSRFNRVGVNKKYSKSLARTHLWLKANRSRIIRSKGFGYYKRRMHENYGRFRSSIPVSARGPYVHNIHRY